MAEALAIDRTDLEAIAEVDEQTTWRVNQRDPRGRGRRFGSVGVSANMTHAKVARDPAKPKPAKAPAPAAPVEAPPIAKPRPRVGGFIENYSDIVEICRDRADLMELSRHETDRLVGLPEGHAGHVLALSLSKPIGPIYLLPLLEHFGLRLIVIEDPQLTAKTLARRTPRDASHVHYPREVPALPAPDPETVTGGKAA
jgi:hypothetical protein